MPLKSKYLQFSLKAIITIALLLVTGTDLTAQIGNGLGTGKYGTFNTYSASILNKGFFSTYNQGRVYVAAGLSGISTVKNINLWHAANNFTFAYGIYDHFDALISIGTYQDLNIRGVKNKQSTVPGDLFVVLRSGGFEFVDGKIGLGASLGFRVPTGGQQNIPFEVYKSDNFEVGILGMATYYGNPYYKDQSFLFNVNLGVWSHNDNGKVVNFAKNNKIESDVNSMAFQFGFGTVIPVKKVQLMLDAYGIAYLTEPVEEVYSRESFVYVTPGIRYNILPWINIGSYVDVLVAGKTDNTAYSQLTGVLLPGEGNPGSGKGAPNYASWRLGFSLGFNILPVNFYSSGSDQKRKRLLDRLLEEERGAQKAATQLEKLKKLRLNAEKELEKIRKDLEENKSE